jgi:hypothetical protein
LSLNKPVGIATTFTRDGCLSLGRLFEPTLIDAARAEFERQFPDVSKLRLPQHLQVGHRRLQLPIEFGGAIASPMLSAHPLLLTIIRDLLGEDAVIDSVTCVVALPGAKEQRLHRDHPQLGLSATFAVTVSIPLIDLTEVTGSTLLFPGSQVDDQEPENRGSARASYSARGDCYMMDYALWHQGLANRSDHVRPVLYFVYARPWFTDARNFRTHARVNIAADTLMTMPLAQRRLFRRLAAKGAHDLTEAELLGMVSPAGFEPATY